MEVQDIPATAEVEIPTEKSFADSFSVFVVDENGNRIVSMGDFDLSEPEVESVTSFIKHRGVLFSAELSGTNLLFMVSNDGVLIGKGNYNSVNDSYKTITLGARKIRRYTVIVVLTDGHSKQSVIEKLGKITGLIEERGTKSLGQDNVLKCFK